MIPPTIIADLGCNHRGSFRTALRMLEVLARYCTEHFDIEGHGPPPVAKFQKRSNMSLYPEEPHPHPHNSYGDTYRAHREALEFSRDHHELLKLRAEELGLVYSCSVWDMIATREIVSLDPCMVKVPSPRNQDFDILGYLCDEYGGELHVSLGMVTHDEIDDIIEFIEKRERLRDTVIYACTSGYPVPFEDVCLGEFLWMRDHYGDHVKAVGFSGHHLGIAVDSVAAALGARFIERHFTLNRSWKGTDHAASLEPDGIRRVLRDTAHIVNAMNCKPGDTLLEIEAQARRKLKEHALIPR